MPVNYQKNYDGLDYDERVEFRDLTIKTLLEIYPHYIVRPLEPNNPDVVFIGNKQDNVRVRYPLSDLYARFSTTGRTKNDLKDVLLTFASTFKMVEDAEMIRDTSKISWNDVKERTFPRLARRTEIPVIDDLVHFPFGEDLITIFLFEDEDEEGLLFRIDKKMLERWEISEQDLLGKAMENLSARMDNLELVGTAPPHAYLRTDSSDEYTATAILIGGVRYTIAQTIGEVYRFGVPSRYVFIAWRELEDEDFQIEMRAWMKREFKRLPAPLTDKIYEVNEKGEMKQLKDLPEISDAPFTSNN